MPMKGSELGLLSMAASLVLAVGTAYQWIQRVDDAHAAEGAGEHARGLVGGMSTLVRSALETEHGVYTQPVIKSWTWWQSGGLEFGFGQHIDGLSVMLLLLVAFISLLVQIYSLEYVRGDRRYTHFFAALTLFSAGMLVMVLAENMVQLILGWEIMGLCSFMLIGHWWEEEANSRAALKAFFTVRVGDVGLLVGTAILFGAMGTFSIQEISLKALDGSTSHTVLLMVEHRPVHRLHRQERSVPAAHLAARRDGRTDAGVVAAALLDDGRRRRVPGRPAVPGLPHRPRHQRRRPALQPDRRDRRHHHRHRRALAFVQADIKKVLAYSTVSQLGYMMMGLGVGAWVPAVFHIFTHAFFKCCLFLCAGSVSHTGSHHSFDMKKDMGGLAKKMPVTASCWIIATRRCAACRSSRASSRRTRSSTTPTTTTTRCSGSSVSSGRS